MLMLLRVLAGLALGTAVFAGLLFLLVVVNFTQRLENPAVYKAAISDTGAYSRIYDEVLADEALREQTASLLGDIDLAAHDEAVQVLREVMPPAYLREQTEDNIDRFTGFLRGDLDRLELYVILKEPLERVEPALRGRVHRVIDELEIADPPPSDCSPSVLQRLAAESAAPYSRLSQGKLPESAPSLKILSRECREREWDRWFDLVADHPSLDSQTALIIGGRREELRETFVEGDTRGFLKAVADPAVEPLIDDALADVRRDLPADNRLDLLEWQSERSQDPTGRGIEEHAETLREVVGAVNGPGRTGALTLVALGSLLLALVHLPRPAAMLRWPGVTLALGGVVCLAVGVALNAAVPGRVREAFALAASKSGNAPASMTNLAGDLLESFLRQATAGFIPAAVSVMVLGVVLVVASLFWGALSSPVRRILSG